jgi:integrase
VKTASTVKTWEKTRLQNLVRHKSGRYYARLFLNGKEIWKSLKTSHFSVAESKLAELQKDHHLRKGRDIDPANAKMTFQDAATLYGQRIADDVSLKRRTKKYFNETLESFVKSWPELPSTELRRVTEAACREWAVRYSKAYCATRYNATISLLRRIFAVGIENGILYANPAANLKRVSVKAKRLELPTREQFVAFIAEVRAGQSRDSKNCADLAEGLAYTGMRIAEAGEATRWDVSFTSGEIRVAGDPEEGTKNSEVRYVPLIPQAEQLFKRMLAERPDEDRTAKLFRVRECQKSMDRAAEKVGMARITHHDLRHFFATISIESGVDIPTVSRWLGHKDGGALAMKTYGHLRREHSIAQAQKVSFAPIAAAA